MTSFKVRCLNNQGGYENELTIGRIYEATISDARHYYVQSDSEWHIQPYQYRFERLSENTCPQCGKIHS
jgi:hypothetical protein